MLAWIFAGSSGDLGREQDHDQTVLVGRPHGAVVAQETCPGALLAAETARAIDEAWNEPLESYRNLVQPPAETLYHLVNHAAAYQRFPNRGSCRPLSTMRQQIADRGGKVMIRVHQTRRRCHDAMSIRVRVVTERQTVL